MGRAMEGGRTVHSEIMWYCWIEELMIASTLFPFTYKTSSLVLYTSVLVLHTRVVTEVRIRLVTSLAFTSADL